MPMDHAASFACVDSGCPERPRLDRTATAPLPDIRQPRSPRGKGKSSRSPSMKKPFRMDRTGMSAIERELNRALEGLGLLEDSEDDGEQAAGGTEDAPRKRSWRHRLVCFLHSGPVHTAATVLLIMDLILVVVSLELQIQVLRLEATAYTDCLHEYEKGHAVPLPLENDTTCNPEGLHTCDPHHSESYERAHQLHTVELGLAVVSCIILTLFLVENILMIVALRWRFFFHFFFVLDIVVVSVSLGLEIWAIVTATFEDLEMLLGIIILGRMWRFFRVAHGLYFLEHAEEEGHEAERENYDDYGDAKEGAKSAPGVMEQDPRRLSRLAEEAQDECQKDANGNRAVKSNSSNAV